MNAALDQQALECLYDPATYDESVPFSTLESLREHAAVSWIEEHQLAHWPGGDGFWLVTRHQEACQVLKQASVFSSHLGATQMRNPATSSDLQFVRQMMLNMDPPAHTRLRRLLQNSFTSRAVANLQAGINRHAANIIDRVVDAADSDSGECNFATDIAADMPLLCLADLFGMPAEDRYLLFDWANRVIGFQDPEYATSSSFEARHGSEIARAAVALRPAPDANGAMPDPRSRSGMPDLYHYAHLLARHKRQHPGDDIMSLLLAQQDAVDGQVSVEEFENMFWLFAVAGNETVRNGLPGGMLGLLQHPAAMQELREQPELIDSAVDEMLRWWTPVMNFRRTATEDCSLAGAAIKKGDKVIVSFTAANRDPRQFEKPDAFNIRRTPNQHLSFGYGPHFCLGAILARAQMRAMFSELLTRFSSIELNGSVRFLRSNFQRGIKTLPVRWQLA